MTVQRTHRSSTWALVQTTALTLALSCAPAHAATTSSAIDLVVHDVCSKRVVLLGEDAHHGSGATLSAKVAIVEALVDGCGFNAVAFESGFYDFVDFGRALDRSTASRATLADAIGGLWSVADAMQPLIDFLFVKASSGTVRVVGIDPQLGGATSHYAQDRMPGELAAYLDGDRQDDCRAEIDRLTNWRYDDKKTFYDDATRGRLRTCAKDIESAAARSESSNAELDAQMARQIGRSLELDGAAGFARRNVAMAENLEGWRTRLGPGAKIIVWCATVHAAKSALEPHSDRRPMGQLVLDSLGDQVAAIGFTAVAGTYGRPDSPPTALAKPPVDSIERLNAPLHSADARYLDRNALIHLGRRPSRSLDYDRFNTTAWADVLDGIVILRKERPMRAAHITDSPNGAP